MSHPDETDRLARRVRELERRYRRLQVALGIVVGTVSLVALTAQVPLRQKITAEQFTLVDGANRARATLEVPAAGAGQGGPSLTMMDEQGKAVLRLRASASGGVLEIIDSKGEVVKFPDQPAVHRLTKP